MQILVWFLDEKGHALDLLFVVKCQAADKSIWIGSFALLNFPENLRRVGASKHWQLP